MSDTDEHDKTGNPYVQIFRMSCIRTYRGHLVRRIGNTIVTIFSKRERTLDYKDVFRVSIKTDGKSVYFVPGNFPDDDSAIQAAINYCDSADLAWTNVSFETLLGEGD
jgi:hypothetical protein